MEKKQSYKELLHLITENLSNKKDKLFVKKNIENLTDNFIYLSDILTNISFIVLDENTSLINKIKSLKQSLPFSDKQIKTLMKKIYINPHQYQNISQTGGNNTNDEKEIEKALNICMFNMPQLMLKGFLNLPKLSVGLLYGIFDKFTSILKCLFDTDFLIQTNDFKKPIDYIYIILFIAASVPFAGVIADFIIICRALLDRRFFLATMVCITMFMSMFLMHSTDLGIIVKILYGIDNFSYINYPKTNHPVSKTIDGNGSAST